MRLFTANFFFCDSPPCCHWLDVSYSFVDLKASLTSFCGARNTTLPYSLNTLRFVIPFSVDINRLIDFFFGFLQTVVLFVSVLLVNFLIQYVT